MIEQLTQGLAFIAGLMDRLVLTAVLLRTWGDARFEAWSLCVAVAGLVSVFEFGFSLYFNNRLMEDTEQNRLEAAKRTFFIANGIFGAVASLGFLSIAALVLFFTIKGSEAEPAGTLTVLVLAAGTALRIAAGGVLSLYRANRQYARLVAFLAFGEMLRVLVAIAACLLGGGLLGVGLAATLAALVPQVFLPVLYGLRRFRPHRLGFALMDRSRVVPVLVTSSAFFAQSVPVILLNSLPVLYLGQAGLGAGMLAMFVLVRTLSGFPRALLQQFGIALGQECGRRLAVGDKNGALTVVAQGARLYSVLSGVATGLLLGAGFDIAVLWTGSSKYIQLDYLVAAVFPMVLAAQSVLALNVLTATNAPGFAALGRWAQLTLTGVIVVLLPAQDLPLSVLIALTAGEVMGFVPLACYGAARLVPGTNAFFHFNAILVCIGVAIFATGLTYGLVVLLEPTTVLERSVAIVLALLANALLIPWMGLRSGTRQALVEQFIYPLVSVVRGMGRRS